MGCLAHPKMFVAKHPLLANADKIQKYKIERFLETKELFFVNCVTEPPGKF